MSNCTTVSSDEAVVIVVEDPLITTQPIPGEICNSQTYSMSVVATGYTASSLSYQWQIRDRKSVV